MRRIPCISVGFLADRKKADASGRVVYGEGVQPIACWDCGLNPAGEHGRLSVLSVVSGRVEISATG